MMGPWPEFKEIIEVSCYRKCASAGAEVATDAGAVDAKANDAPIAAARDTSVPLQNRWRVGLRDLRNPC
jgi:hypothetical protein